MPDDKYIYSFRYDPAESMLSKLESRLLFKKEEKDKLLFSDFKIEADTSAFIKTRLDVVSSSLDYESLIHQIKNKNIRTEGFKVEYLILNNDQTGNSERLSKIREVGFSIDTFPDYQNPTVTYGICTYEGTWYFGVINKNNFSWQKHKQKPISYSNSIKQNIAKALVNIAVESNRDLKILDACCGAGTIMLEACYEGHDIEGCDISWKTCNNARANLSHFNYVGEVHCADIKDITNKYDAAIIDLPYNLYSPASDEDILNIIKSTSEISNRLVIVSTKNIQDPIERSGLKLIEYCEVSKRGKSKFTRKVWVCSKTIE